MKALIASLLTLTSTIALAGEIHGGISGGGGGTTNPVAVSQQRVIEIINLGALPVLSYLRGSEFRYFNGIKTQKTFGDKDIKLFQKLFAGRKSIFEVFAGAKIEVRTNDSCYDSNQNPWDGSIFSNVPGAICISAKTMAPKLNERNVIPETLALVVHELSHLSGANEDEARAIQEDAITVFSNLKFDQFEWSAPLAKSVVIVGMQEPADAVIANPQSLAGKQLDYFTSALMQNFSLNIIRFGIEGFSAVSYTTHMTMQAYGSMIDNITTAACFLDRYNRPSDRKVCRDAIDRVFRNDKSLTVAEYLSRRTNLPAVTYGPEAAKLVINKLTNYTQIAAEVRRFRAILDPLEAEVRAHNAAKYQVIMN